jgi:hypothetical protein
MVKSCSNCGKSHRNRVTDLCNECRPKKEYPLCITCNEKKVYSKTHTICKECFKKELKIYSFI